MSPDGCSRILILVSHLLLILTAVVATPSSAEVVTDLVASETKSSHSNTFTSSRHKRAPGWGKRNFGREELIDESPESTLGETKNNNVYREVVLLSPETPMSSEKRAPGWGKRAPGWGKRAPGWGKRSCNEVGCFNSAHHFNKITNDDLDVNDDDDYVEKTDRGLIKRAPGWGKRNYGQEFDTEGADAKSTNNEEIELLESTDNVRELLNRIVSLPRATLSHQNSIFEDKRAPGWGKRNQHFDFTEDEAEADKRAPGWGKRAPGWGKRSYLDEVDDELFENNKRAPGWGKRAPGWGKRAPGWGKRSVPENCQDLHPVKGDFTNKVEKSPSRIHHS